MGRSGRLSAEERRESILMAARSVFAENGFRGTTTRALAESAGVSEALLFQHFPNKEALYSAMHSTFLRDQDSPAPGQMSAMRPSTETLVHIVNEFYRVLIEEGEPAKKREQAILARLIFRSLMEDGEFARLFLRRVALGLISRIEQCIPAALAAGDLDTVPVHQAILSWFTHHLAVTLMLHQLQSPPVIDYGVTNPELIEEAVRFALRGIGLKEAAIRRYYRLKASNKA
jgi:AcrR family transcriptional regulator